MKQSTHQAMSRPGRRHRQIEQTPEQFRSLQRSQPERAMDQQVLRPWSAQTGLPGAQTQQGLDLLAAADLTTGQETEIVLLTLSQMRAQAHSRSKRTAIAETQQRFETMAKHPGLTRHSTDLVAKGHFPAGRMHPGSSGKASNGTAPVVACWRSSIG